MSLFRKQSREPERPHFDPALYEPVIRMSICTGERVACLREKQTGKLHEWMLVRTEEDLDRFCRETETNKEDIKTVY